MSSGVLAEAIEGVEIGLDPTALVAVMGLRDRLDAKIAAAVVAELDAAGLWDDDGSVSIAAWLRAHAGQTSRQAKRLTTTAARLRGLPAVQAAWAEGRLAGRHGRPPGEHPHTPTDRHPAPPGAPAGAISANGPACVVPAAVS